jgi:hypothetical protein
MPRRPRPPKTSRSEHWLRYAVNDQTIAFDAEVKKTLALGDNESIEWLSPVASDEFAEYYDKSFLTLLGIDDSKAPLESFWPASGPRWDGLARTSAGKVILVEAKAYIAEAVDFGSKAGDSSLKLIESSLAKAKSAYRARAEAVWIQPFYQYANRLAHLYYLRELLGAEAYLLFVCVTDAPDVPLPASAAEWRGAIAAIECALGLGVHPFKGRIGHLFWQAPRDAA